MDIIDNKALLVRTRNPDRITDKIVKSKVIGEENGIHQVLVNWGFDEVQTLATLNLNGIPSPIKKDYQWTGKLTPFAHQIETSSFLTTYRKAFCFSEQGTAKTASAIWAADYLMNLGRVKRVLILCPLSIMKSVWQQEIFRFAMHRSCEVAHGTAKARAKVIDGGAEFIVINFDGLGVVKKEVMAGGFDLIIVDEANSYKNVSTNRWKVIKDVSAKVDWLWMMTGTPAAQSPVDAYGLAKLVNPDNTPKFFGRFRDSVMYKVTQFKWMPKPHAQQIVHSLLQPAIRYERDQCLDLPPLVVADREAPLTAQQRAVYKKLKTDMFLEAAGEDISAVNAAVKINKLLQISGGSVYTDNGEVVDFDVSNRLNAVLEVIEEASHKVLVFVPFTHTIELLREFLEKNKISCDVINGKVPHNKRSDIVTAFQNQPDPHVLIIQPQAASHGLTLTEADTIIWYAPVTSVETYLQANARINRPGQKHSMSIIHIHGSEVEVKLYAMLRNNIMNHQRVIDLYRQEILQE